MILDWFCPRCGASGAAVALKSGEEAKRVELSHRYVEQSRRTRERWRQNRCHGESIRYVERPAKPIAY